METKKVLASKKTERWLIVGIILAFVVSIFLSSVNPNKIKNIENTSVKTSSNTSLTIGEYETREITVAEQTYNVLISDTSDKRILGLSNRTALPDGIDGMLFVFDKQDMHGIWMKDMNFSIDILWLDTDFNVVDQRLNVSPDTFPESFTPSSSALYVLELSA